jgi:hypothetical protein
MTVCDTGDLKTTVLVTVRRAVFRVKGNSTKEGDLLNRGDTCMRSETTQK